MDRKAKKYTIIFKWIISIPMVIIGYFLSLTVLGFVINIVNRGLPLLIDVLTNTARNHDFTNYSLIAAACASYITLTLVNEKFLKIEKLTSKIIIALPILLSEITVNALISVYLEQSLFNASLLRTIGLLIGSLTFISTSD
jgi:hypothetical protein